MKLTKAPKTRIDLISGRNDVMAVGARKAVKEHASDADRDLLIRIAATGCDGAPSTGQAWCAPVIFPPPLWHRQVPARRLP